MYDRDLFRIAATADRNAEPRGDEVELECEILELFLHFTESCKNGLVARMYDPHNRIGLLIIYGM